MIEDIIDIFQDVNPIAKLYDAAKQSCQGDKEEEAPFARNPERPLCHKERQQPKQDEHDAAEGGIVKVLRQVGTCPCQYASRYRNAVLEEERGAVPPATVLHEVHQVGIPHIKEVPSQQDEIGDEEDVERQRRSPLPVPRFDGFLFLALFQNLTYV